MLNSTFIKEYLPTIFYIIVIFNIIFRVIITKKSKKKKRKKKKHKGGGVSNLLYTFFRSIFTLIICIMTLGGICDWDWLKNAPVLPLPTPRQIANWDGSGRDFGDWEVDTI